MARARPIYWRRSRCSHPVAVCVVLLSSVALGCATATPETGDGQCFEVCESTANCGPGTQCVTRAGLAFRLCLPVGTTP